MTNVNNDKTKKSMTENKTSDGDPIDYFESSLETLFGHHQPATGEPGQLCKVYLDGESGDTVQYRIPFSQTNKHFAHYQWDSGLFLGHLIYRSSSKQNNDKQINSDLDLLNSFDYFRPEANMNNQSILELGAGTGLPSIISAKFGGASKVLITDYPDQSILNALEENLSLSSIQTQNSTVKIKGLDWSNEQTIKEIQKENPSGFERVLCADVLWLSSSHQPLLNSIRSTLAFTPHSRCIIVSGFHTGRRALSRFFQLACSQSSEPASPRLVPSTNSDGDLVVYEYNVVTKQARRWSGTKPFLSTSSLGEEDLEYDNMDDFVERTKWLLYVCLEWEL